MSAILVFYHVYKSNFDPKHGFLSSIEVEIISFLIFQGGSPSKLDEEDLEACLKKCVSFIGSVPLSYVPVI